eukprot:scpid106975/ scgid3369/ 
MYGSVADETPDPLPNPPSSPPTASNRSVQSQSSISSTKPLQYDEPLENGDGGYKKKRKRKGRWRCAALGCCCGLCLGCEKVSSAITLGWALLGMAIVGTGGYLINQ